MVFVALQSLLIKGFRCFEYAAFSLDAPIVFIKGNNGTGKTSLLEALYYTSNLRSFRTHMPKELIRFQHDAFFLKVQAQMPSGDQCELAVGLSSAQRSIKINGKRITSYKDLLASVRILSVSEDDLMLITGSPEQRRNFIDHAIVIHDPTMARLWSSYRKVLANRNALLKTIRPSRDLYHIWTQQLTELTAAIVQERRTFIGRLAQRTHALIPSIPGCPAISFHYQPYKGIPSEELINNADWYDQEVRAGRSLFGAHLDDILISFGNQSCKVYASRGQQKLTLLALKIALIKDLQAHNKPVTALLLDDFLSDLDEQRIKQLLSLLIDLHIQLIFTCPTYTSSLESLLASYTVQHIVLS